MELIDKIKRLFVKDQPVRLTRPDHDWFARNSEHSEYTPDLHKLEQHEFQNVFIYGQHKRGLPYNEFLGGIWRATAYTEDRFTLWNDRFTADVINGPDGPVTPVADQTALALPSAFFNAPERRIQGEIFSLNVKEIMELDKHMMNGVEFNRERVTLILPYREKRFFKEREHANQFNGKDTGRSIAMTHVLESTQRAWMYIGNLDYWKPRLDGGYRFTLCRAFKRKTPGQEDYYNYTELEYNDGDS